MIKIPHIKIVEYSQIVFRIIIIAENVYHSKENKN